MSQANLQISASTDTGTTLADKLNAWREAVYSMQRGAARPSYAIAGFQWLDEVSSTQWNWYFFDGTEDIKVAQIDPTTHQFTLAADNFYIQDILSKDLDGLNLRSQNGTLVLRIGANNTTDIEYGSFRFNLSGGNLIISNGGTGLMKLDLSGNLTVAGNITAYGSV